MAVPTWPAPQKDVFDDSARGPTNDSEASLVERRALVQGPNRIMEESKGCGARITISLDLLGAPLVEAHMGWPLVAGASQKGTMVGTHLDRMQDCPCLGQIQMVT